MPTEDDSHAWLWDDEDCLTDDNCIYYKDGQYVSDDGLQDVYIDTSNITWLGGIDPDFEEPFFIKICSYNNGDDGDYEIHVGDSTYNGCPGICGSYYGPGGDGVEH